MRKLGSAGRRCAICRTDVPRGRGWHQDHCHATEEPRGILCGSCNLMLGHAKDSIDTLQRAIEYLQSYAPPIETPA